MIDCPTEETIAACVDGGASEATRARVNDHVDHCDACRGIFVAWAAAFVPSEAPSVATLEPGTEIDRFVVGRELGRGARGIVVLARDRMLDREVVLKLAARRNDPHEHASVVAEGKALAALAHPNVVRVFDLGEWAGHVYIAMESIDAVDLRTWLGRGPTSQALLAVLRDVARGLAALHGAGIVHRDVKPENVVVGIDGIARVIDLDLAVRRDDGRHTRPIHAVRAAGTPCYMAPEALAGAPPRPSADVYAFCRMAIEASGAAGPLHAFFASGLDGDPEARPTMDAIAARLAKPATSRPERRRAIAAGASVVAALGFAVLAFACASKPPAAPDALPAPVAVVSVAVPAAPSSTADETMHEAAEQAPVPPSRSANLVDSTPRSLRLLVDSTPRSLRSLVDPFAPQASTNVGPSFDRSAATRAVASVDVRRCSAASGTPQRVIVDVVFRPRGEVERISVIRGGPATACLDKLFRGLRVKPYVGGNERVDRTFTIVVPDDRRGSP